MYFIFTLYFIIYTVYYNILQCSNHIQIGTGNQTNDSKIEYGTSEPPNQEYWCAKRHIHQDMSIPIPGSKDMAEVDLRQKYH